MEGLKSINIPCLTITLMAFASIVECRDPVLHRVGGGKYTWSPNINFSAWASREQFYVGDWLYFGFDKHQYNVLQVNKTAYENCMDRGFIANITKGGRDVFNLTRAGKYYFLCGGSCCFRGMKLAVNVTEFPSPSQIVANGSPRNMFPSPSQNFTNDSSLKTHSQILFLLLAIAMTVIIHIACTAL